ncbi:MAG: hypothetical protein JWN93_2828, partial [Hyphomicrobiales bacterium]|nr:hypothetical protein [Hyphomicrobiales bacterium]
MNRSAPLLNLWERALYGLMRLLPVELTSATGGFLVRTNVRWNRPEILAGARRNLKLHHPDLAEVEADRMVWRFLDNIGRFMAEFAVLDKLLPQGRIELAFHEDFLRAAGREPIIIVVLHTGNWEVFSPALQSAGVRNAAFY